MKKKVKYMNRNKHIIDENGFINVYVSGYRVNVGTRTETSGYGIYWGPKNQFNVGIASRKNLSENAEEVQGATVMFKHAAQLTDLKKLRMNANSSALYAAVTELMSKWKQTDWRVDGKKVQNCSAYKKLDKLFGKLSQAATIEFNYIPANSGNVHQSEADRSAMKVVKCYCREKAAVGK